MRILISLILVGLSICSLKSQSDTTNQNNLKGKLELKHWFSYGLVYQNQWNVNGINKLLNVTENSNYMGIVKYSQMLFIKRKFLVNLEASILSGWFQNLKDTRIGAIRGTFNVGYSILNLQRTQGFLNLNYSYGTFSYYVNYLPDKTSINLNPNNFNGGTFGLYNTTSLLGSSMIFVFRKENQKIKTILEISYKFGIGKNHWRNDKYNLNNFRIQESFSMTEFCFRI
jgi:hypothetical protein